tara:strand:+ start:2083 stop:2541 length:459 start_codon:yes stop_codon:yes gene_type:complete
MNREEHINYVTGVYRTMSAVNLTWKDSGTVLGLIRLLETNISNNKVEIDEGMPFFSTPYLLDAINNILDRYGESNSSATLTEMADDALDWIEDSLSNYDTVRLAFEMNLDEEVLDKIYKLAKDCIVSSMYEPDINLDGAKASLEQVLKERYV